MTYYQTFPPDKFEDGDELIECNCIKRTIDFNHKKVLVRNCNCYDMVPVNSENVIIESELWGAVSMEEEKPVSQEENETSRLLDRLVEISAMSEESATMVIAKMAEKSDVLPIAAASEIMAAKPPIEKVG